MLKRLFSVSVVLTLAASLAHAAVRNPQVPVSGTALATFFASQGQTIDVNTQQLDLQSLSVPPTTGFEVRVFGGVQAVQIMDFGEYDTTPDSPPLCPIVRAAPTTGYWSIAHFITSPIRLEVIQIRPDDTLLGSVTYANANSAAFGFYAHANVGSGDTFYMQDSRNPDGAAKILAYNGTGSRLGWTWFAVETGAGSGGDFADFVGLVNLSLAPVPVNRSSWGRIKQLFK